MNEEAVPKTHHVRVRLVFEGEYDLTTGTLDYGGATELSACIEIDRNQFLVDDTHLLLDVVNARPVSFELIGDTCNCGHSRTDHFRDSLNCMFSTENETWACGCHEYKPA